MPLPCDIEILEDHVQEITSKSYSVCDSQVPVELSPDDLSIIETGNWCSWQPTYWVTTPPGDPIGLDPNHPGTTTITTWIQDHVYDKLKAEFDAYKAQFEGSAAFNYVNQIAYHDEWEAYAGTINASYAQMNQQIYAQSLEIQTASADWNSTLATRISETEAAFTGAVQANTELYQQSYASLEESVAMVGATAWLTDPVSGKQIVSGFKASASTDTGSEFVIFADTFRITTGVANYEDRTLSGVNMMTPFSVVNGTVYIGNVDTSKPQITYTTEYASAPSTAGLAENSVYKNTTNGNTYILKNGVWTLWITKGADGADGQDGEDGANGTRGSIHITVTGTYSSGATSSATFQNATGLADKVIGDWITFNSTTGAKDYYRSSNGGDTWVNAALYVDGNLLVTNTIYADRIVSDNLASATTYYVSGSVTAVGTFGSVLTTSNTNSIGSFTVTNTSGAKKKIVVIGTGRSGINTPVTTETQSFGVFVGSTSVFDYGWTPLGQDAKACSTVYTIPSGGSVTFDVRGTHTTYSGSHGIGLNFAVLGVRN